MTELMLPEHWFSIVEIILRISAVPVFIYSFFNGTKTKKNILRISALLLLSGVGGIILLSPLIAITMFVYSFSSTTPVKKNILRIGGIILFFVSVYLLYFIFKDFQFV